LFVIKKFIPCPIIISHVKGHPKFHITKLYLDPFFTGLTRCQTKEGNTTKIFETLRFLGKTVNVTTEHVIEKPDRHIVKMLDGQAKGTIFDEKYEKVGDKTKVTIEVDFVLSGGLKILGMFAKSKIESSMKMVLDEFANYAKKQSQ
jgi:hypothetical protein